MRNRRGQVDVAHALAAHPRLAHLHAALLADHAAVLEALVLAADALEVLQGAEDAGAEKAVALGLEGPVVDGFGLAYFAPRPRLDHLGDASPMVMESKSSNPGAAWAMRVISLMHRSFVCLS